MAKDSNGLTDKQKRFCSEYLKDFNATAAYLRAGYQCTRAAAERASSRLLRNVEVQAYLAIKRSRIEERSEITLEKTMREIGRIAFGDITQMLSFDPDNGVAFKNSKSLPKSVTAAISEVKSTTRTRTSSDGSVDVSVDLSAKMHSKNQALALLADFFGVRDDFNKARASLRRYGIELAPDESAELGWRLERYASSEGSDS